MNATARIVRTKHFLIASFSCGELEAYLSERAELINQAAAFRRGDYSTAVYRKLSASPYPRVSLEARLMIPTLIGARGDSSAAVEQFVALLPQMKTAAIDIRGHYLNNLAFELFETGELEAAGKVSDVALANPFADRNPTWHDTRRRIAEAVEAKARLQSIAVVHRPGDLLKFPERLNRQTREADFNRILECAVGLCPVRMRRARRAVEAV